MPWEIADYVEQYRNSAPAGATGTCTITFDAPKAGTAWRVETISVVCNSATTTELFVYTRTPSASTPPAAATKYGNLTVGDGTPLTVRPPGALVLVWRNVSPGTTAYARVQYLLLQGASAGAPGPLSA